MGLTRIQSQDVATNITLVSVTIGNLSITQTASIAGQLMVGTPTASPDGKIKVLVNDNAAEPTDLSLLTDYPFVFVGKDGERARLVLDAYVNGVSTSSPILTFRSASGTAAAPSATADAYILANLSLQGYGSTARPSSTRSFMYAASSALWTDISQPFNVYLRTTPAGSSGSSASTRIKIFDDGAIIMGGTSTHTADATPGAGIVQIAGPLNATTCATIQGLIVSTTLTMSNYKIVNVADPTDNQDAATKKYVDDSVAVENIWDRTGSVITPVTLTDGVQIANLTVTATATISSLVVSNTLTLSGIDVNTRLATISSSISTNTTNIANASVTVGQLVTNLNTVSLTVQNLVTNLNTVSLTVQNLVSYLNTLTVTIVDKLTVNTTITVGNVYVTNGITSTSLVIAKDEPFIQIADITGSTITYQIAATSDSKLLFGQLGIGTSFMIDVNSNLGFGNFAPLSKVDITSAAPLRFGSSTSDGFVIAQYNTNDWSMAGINPASTLRLQNSDLIISDARGISAPALSISVTATIASLVVTSKATLNNVGVNKANETYSALESTPGIAIINPGNTQGDWYTRQAGVSEWTFRNPANSRDMHFINSYGLLAEMKDAGSLATSYLSISNISVTVTATIASLVVSSTVSMSGPVRIQSTWNFPTTPTFNISAPFQITNGSTQAIMIDSNQIESIGGALHLNNRLNEVTGKSNDTNINGNGGNVILGSTVEVTLSVNGQAFIATTLSVGSVAVTNYVGIGVLPIANYRAYIQDDSDANLAVISGSSSNSILVLGDQGDHNKCRIIYNNATDDLSISTDGSNKLTIDSAGLSTFTGTIACKRLQALCGNSSYVAEGVFHADALTHKFLSPGEGILRIGYSDAGSGQYAPSIGFDNGSTAYDGSLLALQSKINHGTPESYNRWQMSQDGKISWGAGSTAIDTDLSRSNPGELKTSGTFVAKNYLVPVPTATQIATGIIATFTASVTMTFGSVGYINSLGMISIATSSLSVSLPAIAMCAQSQININTVGNFLLNGIAKNTGWSFTRGLPVYTSLLTVTQNISQTQPTESGYSVQILGIAKETDTIVFNPSLITLEIV